MESGPPPVLDLENLGSPCKQVGAWPRAGRVDLSCDSRRGQLGVWIARQELGFKPNRKLNDAKEDVQVFLGSLNRLETSDRQRDALVILNPAQTAAHAVK